MNLVVFLQGDTGGVEVPQTVPRDIAVIEQAHPGDLALVLTVNQKLRLGIDHPDRLICESQHSRLSSEILTTLLIWVDAAPVLFLICTGIWIMYDCDDL